MKEARRIVPIVVVFGALLTLLAIALPAGAAQPDRFTLKFSDAYLVYSPPTGTLQVAAESTVLSYGADWEVVTLKPYLYHLRLKTWSGFYWKVVYKVTGGTFGTLGGTDTKIGGIAVEPVGGSDTSAPERFFLRFSDAKLVYAPGTGTLQISASGYVLSYAGDWKVVKIYDYLYHLRESVWKNFYWKVNTSRKEVYKVTGGTFGKLGGTDTKIGGITVTVVGGDTSEAPPAGGGPNPGGGAPSVTEDCISFNPDNAAVVKIGGHWKIVDGSLWLLDFGFKKAEAEKALAIIKEYGLNRQCFVGRPDPSFEYWLAGSGAPSGSTPGEDCIAFNPATIEVKYVSGRWKIVDGSHWMFDFDQNEAEARAAFDIIKKYGFTRSCFVGRPKADFKYLRK
jgi:hypothetical protein